MEARQASQKNRKLFSRIFIGYESAINDGDSILHLSVKLIFKNATIFLLAKSDIYLLVFSIQFTMRKHLKFGKCPFSVSFHFLKIILRDLSCQSIHNSPEIVDVRLVGAGSGQLNFVTGPVRIDVVAFFGQERMRLHRAVHIARAHHC